MSIRRLRLGLVFQGDGLGDGDVESRGREQSSPFIPMGRPVLSRASYPRLSCARSRSILLSTSPHVKTFVMRRDATTDLHHHGVAKRNVAVTTASLVLSIGIYRAQDTAAWPLCVVTTSRPVRRGDVAALVMLADRGGTSVGGRSGRPRHVQQEKERRP